MPQLILLALFCLLLVLSVVGFMAERTREWLMVTDNLDTHRRLSYWVDICHSEQLRQRRFITRISMRNLVDKRRKIG